MLIIPAIDIKGGSCVRLIHGDPKKETIYSPNPIEVAQRWVSLGAERLHVIDLDGAFKGDVVNLGIAQEIGQTTGKLVQFGGGLRDLKTVERVLAHGIGRAILGTAILQQPDWVEMALREHASRLIASVDARDGQVMVQGWQAGSGLKIADALRRIEHMGIREIIFTDISKDGTLEGPNLEAIREVLRSTHMGVFASGGVSSLKDIHALKSLESEGLRGCVVGKALYEGTLDLADAIAAAT